MLIRRSPLNQAMRWASTVRSLKLVRSCISRHGFHETVIKNDYKSAQQGNYETGKGFKVASTLAVSVVSAYIGYQLAPRRSGASTLPLSSSPELLHNMSPSNLQAALVEMQTIVGETNVTTTEDEKLQQSDSSVSNYHPAPGETPYAIVFPTSTEEVSAIMKVCHRRRIPVTPYSGGTSSEGQYTPLLGGICVDFSRMNKVIALHDQDLDVVVQPGLGWEHLNELLAESKLFFPPDPGPGAMIGGMVGTGCSGTNAFRYGTMRDWVISLTVVLADGTVVKTRQRPRKTSAGYDLTKIFIGSEGTLGLVTEAVLKVTPLPQSTSVAVASFIALRDAVDCVSKVIADGVQVAAVEILDETLMRCINQSGVTNRVWNEAPTLFFKFAGTPAAIEEHITIVQTRANKSGCQTFQFAKDEDEQKDLWAARKGALWALIKSKRHESDMIFMGDVAVPVSRLADIIEETQEDLRKSELMSSILGHVGDGNFHIALFYNERQKEQADAIAHRMNRRALEMEGTVSGEHGIGICKREYLPGELGDSTVDLMRQLKQAFDTYCLLNCNKVVKMVKD